MRIPILIKMLSQTCPKCFEVQNLFNCHRPIHKLFHTGFIFSDCLWCSGRGSQHLLQSASLNCVVKTCTVKMRQFCITAECPVRKLSKKLLAHWLKLEPDLNFFGVPFFTLIYMSAKHPAGSALGNKVYVPTTKVRHLDGILPFFPFPRLLTFALVILVLS